MAGITNKGPWGLLAGLAGASVVYWKIAVPMFDAADLERRSDALELHRLQTRGAEILREREQRRADAVAKGEPVAEADKEIPDADMPEYPPAALSQQPLTGLTTD